MAGELGIAVVIGFDGSAALDGHPGKQALRKPDAQG